MKFCKCLVKDRKHLGMDADSFPPGTIMHSGTGHVAVYIQERGAHYTLSYTGTDWRLFTISKTLVKRIKIWHEATVGSTDTKGIPPVRTAPALREQAKEHGLSSAAITTAIIAANNLAAESIISKRYTEEAKTTAEKVAKAEATLEALIKESFKKPIPEASLPRPVVEKKKTYKPRAKKVEVSTEEFTAKPPSETAYWYESARDSKLLRDFVSLRLAGWATNLMILGPSGFGKTQGVVNFGKQMGVPVHVVNCQAITTPEKWIGQMNATPEKGTFFEVSQHLMWVERVHEDCKDADWCIILYDESTRLRPELANMQFSLLDDQQGLEVPQMGRRVMMHPKNVVIATANFGTAYSGTFAMDWALRGRFDLQLERGIPPKEEERKILTSATGVTDAQADAMIRVADNTRQAWMAGDMESPISTRSLVAWARLVAGGYTIKDAAEYAVYPLYSEDGGSGSDRERVKLAVDGKVGEIVELKTATPTDYSDVTVTPPDYEDEEVDYDIVGDEEG